MTPARKIARRKNARERFSVSRIFHTLFFVVILLVVVLGVFRLFEEWQRRVWLQGSRLTMVVASSNPTVYSYDPSTNTLTVVEIPKDTQVEASGNFGKWLIGSLLQLGEQEGKGGELLKTSLEKAFGLPVDGWMAGDGQVFKERAFGVATVLWLVSGRETNLTFFDRLALLLAVNSVGVLDRRVIDLESAGAVKKTKLPDGFEAYVPVPDRTKTAFELLRDERVFAERKTLLVVNTTSKQGIAGEVARVAGTLGVKVVGTQGATGREVENCIVQGAKEHIDSRAASRLMKIFGCEVKIGDPQGPAHLEIVLGKGFSERF